MLSQVALPSMGPPAVAWPICTGYAFSRKRTNYALKLTGTLECPVPGECPRRVRSSTLGCYVRLPTDRPERTASCRPEAPLTRCQPGLKR
jgi:hypothetical protein